MLQKSIMRVETSFGYMAIGYLGAKIGRVWLPGHTKPRLRKITSDWAQNNTQKTDQKLLNKLMHYFNGECVSFCKSIDYGKAEDFSLKVLRQLSKVKWGERISYGELASKAGYPGCARAVGMVMSKNKVPLIIPCHRVIRSDGSLGGFTAPGGLRMKERLLALENGAG